MTKVCHIISGYFRQDQRIFDRLCLTLVKGGYEVVILTNDGEHDQLINSIKITSCKKVRTSLTGKKSIKRLFFTSLDLVQKTTEINADIYHLHSPEILLLGLYLKFKGKKVIYDAHEDIENLIFEKDWIPSLFMKKFIAKLTKIYLNFVLKRIDGFTTPHHHLINKYDRSIYGKLITNFPILKPKNNNEFANYKQRKNIICYAGTVYKFSNQEQIISAIKKIKMPVEYKIVGNIEKSFLNDLIGISNKKDCPDFQGRLNQNKLRNFFFQASIGIVIYDYVEFLGNKLGSYGTNKLFEYMEVGLPVICTDFLIWEEVVKKYDCGICVSPRDTAGIYEAINFLLQNKERAFQMGLNGRKAIEEKFNWSSQESEYLTMVKSLE